jgi:outer membrane protein insertion porin family
MASDQLEISGGWGMNMFVGSVGITLNNFSIGNVLKKGAWRPYPQGQNQQLSFRAQTNGKYYTAVSASFTEPWLGGRKPNALSVSVYYSSQTDGYWGSGVSKYFRASGVSAGLQRRLSWPDHNFLIYNELGYQHYNLYDWGYGSNPNSSYFIFRTGRSNVFSFRTILSRNSINNFIYPQFGSDFSLSITLTPPYSLFDGKDYRTMQEFADQFNRNISAGIQPTEEETARFNSYNRSRFRFIEYHKWVGKMTWYFPLTSNNKLVLMTKAELGYLGHYNRYKQSPFEGFDLGGDGMSGYSYYGVDVISLRGYEDGRLTPTYGSTNQDYAKVYNKYTVELRHPIIMQPSSYIYALVFAEGGNAYMSWKEFDPFKVKRSLGAGVRLYLPIVGMIGVDWGYGFDVQVGDTKRNGGKVHFMMGMQF